MEALNQLSQALDNKVKRMEVTPISAIYSSYIPKKRAVTNCYFLLTDFPQSKLTSTSILLSNELNSEFNSAELNQINLISLSKMMFEGTKPMEGLELSALFLAIKKQRNDDNKSLL